jgi:hypothetical protein
MMGDGAGGCHALRVWGGHALRGGGLSRSEGGGTRAKGEAGCSDRHSHVIELLLHNRALRALLFLCKKGGGGKEGAKSKREKIVT